MTWYTKSTDDSKGAVESSFYEESKSVSVSDTKDNLDADSTITIPILTRDYFGKSYICEADNNNSTAPASAKVTVDMRRKLLCMFIIYASC